VVEKMLRSTELDSNTNLGDSLKRCCHLTLHTLQRSLYVSKHVNQQYCA